MELYEERVEELGKRKADQLFRRDVLLLFRKNIIKPASGTYRLNSYGMFKNHLKVSLRNLIKQKGYTAINIFGLTVGMAISMLIILFIIDQDRHDEHNSNAADIYRITTTVQDDTEDRDLPLATSPFEFNQLIPLNFQQVVDASQLVKTSGVMQVDDNEFQFTGLFASPNFLEFFQFDLSDGRKLNALGQQNTVVISKEVSKKLFGQKTAIGETISIEKSGDFIVAGVIDKEAYKTHLDYDIILPIGTFTNKLSNKTLLSDWEEGSKIFYNYFRLEKGTSQLSINNYLSSIDAKLSEEKKILYQFSSQRLDEINLGILTKNEIGVTTPAFVAYFFGVLGLVLILSASFNYMNMAIARGLKRAKEVGVRKVLGAGRKQVIIQFLVEAQLVIFASLISAFLLLQLLVPVFNNLKILRDIDGAITMNFNGNIGVYVAFICFALIVGFVSGVYPALYLSSFKSLSVLKGTSSSKKSPSFVFRKLLVFFQYSFSVIFIITTIVLYQQARIFVTSDYGFDHSNIINVPIKKSVPYEAFRSELLKHPEVAGVSAVSNLPVISSFKEVDLTSRNNDELTIKSSIFSIDPYAIDNLGIEILAGKNFSTIGSNENDFIIINEKCASALGYADTSDALNQTLEIHRLDKETRTESTEKKKIIGVIKDFNYQFVFIETGPLVMQYNPKHLTTINIKLEGVSSKKGAEIVESVWNEFDSVHPMKYETYAYGVDDINMEFSELVNIIGLVGFIAILIACLGQFSMVVHHVQLKTKEIGIRKVLGSSLNGLMFGLSRGFIFVILLAITLSTPLAILINIGWTSKVYNAPEISFFNIALGIAIVLVLAIGTIYFFVHRAVRINPAETLKYE